MRDCGFFSVNVTFNFVFFFLERCYDELTVCVNVNSPENNQITE